MAPRWRVVADAPGATGHPAGFEFGLQDLRRGRLNVDINLINNLNISATIVIIFMIIKFFFFYRYRYY